MDLFHWIRYYTDGTTDTPAIYMTYACTYIIFYMTSVFKLVEF